MDAAGLDGEVGGDQALLRLPPVDVAGIRGHDHDVGRLGDGDPVRSARDLGAEPMGGDEVAGDDVQDAAAMVLDHIDDEVEADLAGHLLHAEPARGVGVSQRDLIEKGGRDVRGGRRRRAADSRLHDLGSTGEARIAVREDASQPDDEVGVEDLPVDLHGDDAVAAAHGVLLDDRLQVATVVLGDRDPTVRLLTHLGQHLVVGHDPVRPRRGEDLDVLVREPALVEVVEQYRAGCGRPACAGCCRRRG